MPQVWAAPVRSRAAWTAMGQVPGGMAVTLRAKESSTGVSAASDGAWVEMDSTRLTFLEEK